MEQDNKQRMIEEWGLGKFSPEEQDAFIDKIGQALYQSVALRATDEMSEEQQDAFEAFLAQAGDKVDVPAVLEYLSTNVPGFDQLLVEETAKLKAELTVS